MKFKALFSVLIAGVLLPAAVLAWTVSTITSSEDPEQGSWVKTGFFSAYVDDSDKDAVDETRWWAGTYDKDTEETLKGEFVFSNTSEPLKLRSYLTEGKESVYEMVRYGDYIYAGTEASGAVYRFPVTPAGPWPLYVLDHENVTPDVPGEFGPNDKWTTCFALETFTIGGNEYLVAVVNKRDPVDHDERDGGWLFLWNESKYLTTGQGWIPRGKVKTGGNANEEVRDLISWRGWLIAVANDGDKHQEGETRDDPHTIYFTHLLNVLNLTKDTEWAVLAYNTAYRYLRGTILESGADQESYLYVTTKHDREGNPDPLPLRIYRWKLTTDQEIVIPPEVTHQDAFVIPPGQQIQYFSNIVAVNDGGATDKVYATSVYSWQEPSADANSYVYQYVEVQNPPQGSPPWTFEQVPGVEFEQAEAWGLDVWWTNYGTDWSLLVGTKDVFRGRGVLYSVSP